MLTGLWTVWSPVIIVFPVVVVWSGCASLVVDGYAATGVLGVVVARVSVVMRKTSASAIMMRFRSFTSPSIFPPPCLIFLSDSVVFV